MGVLHLRKSEGIIVPLEGKDNITLLKGRVPTLIKTYQVRGTSDCRG